MQFKSAFCVLALLCVLVQTIEGNCLSYGHSCWGAHGKRSTPQTQPTIDQLAERWALVKLAPERHVNKFVYPEVRDYEEPRGNEIPIQGYKPLASAEFPVNHIAAPSIRLRFGRQRPIKLVSSGDFFESADTNENTDSDENAGRNLQYLNLLNTPQQKYAA